LKEPGKTTDVINSTALALSHLLEAFLVAWISTLIAPHCRAPERFHFLNRAASILSTQKIVQKPFHTISYPKLLFASFSFP